jgi:anti-sigma factor RsiW
MSEYVDGELTATGRARMERHARDCPECEQLLAGLRAVVAGLGRLPAPEGGIDPARLAAAVRARLDDPRAS